jgi:ATP-dependent DNA ligase
MTTIICINAAKPVKFHNKAIKEALERNGSLIANVKYDSVRCHLVIKPSADSNGQPSARAYAFSRTDKLLPSLRELFSSDDDRIALGQLLSESLYPDGLIVDGEALVKGVTFQQGSGILRRKEAIDISRLEYRIYGVMPLSHFLENDKRVSLDVSNCVMQAQLEVVTMQLQELLPSMDWQLAETYDVYSMEELFALYDSVRERKLEGLVIKEPLKPWHRGKKVGWWKMKPEDTVDGTVCGLLWGTVGKANEGKVIGFEVLLESGIVVNVDGLTDAQKEEFTETVYVYNYENGYADSEPKLNPYEGWYVQVKFMEYTDDGSLRHPKFDCWRGTETHPKEKS